MGELNRALKDHELIKIRLNTEDRDARNTTIEQISIDSESHIVQRIGKIALLYKQATRPDPKLSNLLRTDIL